MNDDDDRLISAWTSTFSIVAADPSTGQVGVAVQSKAFAVGAIVPWVRAGVGAVATQAFSLARYGPDLIAALERGDRPQAALTAALSTDQLASFRQIGIIHADGETANHTGSECSPWAGARTGPGFSIQGNLLAGEKVVDEMAQAFKDSRGSLAERLLASLEAGQAAGGDKRGKQSAALLVEELGYQNLSFSGIDRLVDLRVDDHREPIKELRRLFELWQMRNFIDRAIRLYEDADYATAADLMMEADKLYPGNAIILYNLAGFQSKLGLANQSLINLTQAIMLDESYREHAKTDSDFDPIRALPEFQTLILS